MKREILVELDEDRVSVNQDTPTRYAIPPELLKDHQTSSINPAFKRLLLLTNQRRPFWSVLFWLMPRGHYLLAVTRFLFL